MSKKPLTEQEVNRRINLVIIGLLLFGMVCEITALILEALIAAR